MRPAFVSPFLGALVLYAMMHSPAVARYPYPGGQVEVAYDPDAFLRTDLDRWMSLSPELSAYNNLAVPIDVRLCLPEDDDYVGCGPNAPLNVKNIDVNVQKNGALYRDLQMLSAPRGLKPVITYLMEVQTFSLWQIGKEREFFATHHLGALRSHYAQIDPGRSCSDILHQIQNTSQEQFVQKLVAVDWHNCVWNLEARKIGPYPKDAWDLFLSSHGIKEVVKEETPAE